MTIFSRSVVLAAALLASGAAMAAAEPEAPTAPEKTLTQTRWILNSLEGAPAADGVETILILTGEGTAGGNGGCNIFGANAQLDEDEGSLAISEVFSTMMACEPAKMEQEQAFFSALETVARYALESGVLTLYDTEDAEIATLSPQQATPA